MKAIVFDVAGVLLQWQPRAMLKREVPHLAHDENSAAHWELQIFENYLGDWGEFDRGRVGVPELVQRIARRTGLDADDVRTVVDAVPNEMQPMTDTVALLHRLADAGHRLHYLSNMPAPYADLLEARNAFFKRFDSGVFSARVHHNKPEPAIYAVAVERFCAAPRDLVFMDDTVGNVHAARALGWNALPFITAAQAEAELRARGWAAPADQSRNSGPCGLPSAIHDSSSV